MAALYEQRNLSMTPQQWAALEAAAVQTNSRSTRGPDAYQHSWRTLIKRIADGDFALTEKEPYRHQGLIDSGPRAIDLQPHQLTLEPEPA